MISKRLKAIAELISPNQVVADIGCDHALLLCYLSKENKIKKGYAMDIATGPLQQAKFNVDQFALENIECVLSDGLNNLPSEVDCIVIAGLGFRSIYQIINSNFDKLKNINEIIVQCNAEITLFRSFLNQKKANIIDEIWIKDYKDYQIIKFNFLIERNYSDVEVFFGPILFKKKPKLFLKYYQRMNENIKKLAIYRQNPDYLKYLDELKDFF